MKLVFATNNSNKIKEVSNLISNQIEIMSLKDIGDAIGPTPIF